MLRRLVYRLLFGKGGEDMLAMLWAQKIILGTRTYDQVPAKLKDKVADILRESDLEELITE